MFEKTLWATLVTAMLAVPVSAQDQRDRGEGLAEVISAMPVCADLQDLRDLAVMAAADQMEEVNRLVKLDSVACIVAASGNVLFWRLAADEEWLEGGFPVQEIRIPTTDDWLYTWFGPLQGQTEALLRFHAMGVDDDRFLEYMRRWRAEASDTIP